MLRLWPLARHCKATKALAALGRWSIISDIDTYNLFLYIVFTILL